MTTAEIINDIAAGIIAILSIISVVLSISMLKYCKTNRWVYYMQIIACIGLATYYVLVIIASITGNPELIITEIGRSAGILAVGTLVAKVIIDYRKGICP